MTGEQVAPDGHTGIVVVAVLRPEPELSPEARRYGEQVRALQAALDADPWCDRYELAARVIPPDPAEGLAGLATSYRSSESDDSDEPRTRVRQAAGMIETWCPRHHHVHAELLRGMARIYDDSGR